MRIAVPFLCAVFMLPAIAMAGTRIECWTDEHGNRACGDVVPPQYVKQQRDILNNQGVVIGTEARQKTQAELDADEQKAKQDKEAQDKAAKQAAYDQFLLQTYNSDAEIKAARNLRVQTIDGRIGLVHKAIADNQTALKGLLERRDQIVASGKPAGAGLLKQIKSYQASLADNQDSLTKLEAERQQTQDQFNQDIARYNALKNATAKPQPPVSP